MPQEVYKHFQGVKDWLINSVNIFAERIYFATVGLLMNPTLLWRSRDGIYIYVLNRQLS